MADIEALNAVAAANIEAVNGVAKANIETINGVGIGGLVAATYWAVCFDDNKISWAAAADIASESVWATNVDDPVASASSSGTDTIDIAYGKDNSGNGIFLTIGNSSGNNVWVDQNNDITDASNWDRINLADTAKRRTIQWGNDVWVAAGEMGNTRIHRSTDGAANFTSVDVSGLDNIVTGTKVTGLASDGAGNWMFGQAANLYFSSDDAATWAFLLQPEGTGNTINDIVFTNNTWVVLYNNGGAQAWVITCPAAAAANMDDTGDWGTTQRLTGAVYVNGGGTDEGTTHLHGTLSTRMAAAGGRVVFLQSGNGHNDMAFTTAADVSGKTCTLKNIVVNVPVSGSGGTNVPYGIATDGITWLIGAGGEDDGRNGGDICRSTNGGDSWALIVEGIDNDSTNEINGIAPNVYLPL